MAISTQDQLVAALAAAKKFGLYKASVTTEGAGTWQSLWTAAGQPAAGAAQGTANGAIPDNTTPGAIPYTNPGGANSGYLAKLSLHGANVGTLILYDRLWHNSGLSGIVTTAQAITQPALTRYTDGIGVELWMEVYAAMGATASVFTASYTNDANTAGRSATYSMPANALTQNQMVPFALASGDKGVKSVQSVTLSLSTGTAGNFGLMLLKRIAEIPINAANSGGVLDFFGLGGAVLPPSSCLFLAQLCSATTSGVVNGSAAFIEG